MTVEELIDRLSELDPNLNVYRSGYEGGYEEVSYLTIDKIVRNYHKEDEWWYGRHELAGVANSDSEPEDCIIIG